MLIIFLRVLLLYALVVIVMRIMGKRQIGELQPFELAVAIMISELAAVPMEDKDIPLINGVLPIFTLLMAQVALSYTALKSQQARAFICGRPAVIVQDGHLLEEEMRRNRYNINDLLEQLRGKGYANVADVEFAILETNGQLSVIPKSQKRPIIPEDLQIPTTYEGLPLSLVVDGYVEEENLRQANLTRTWLNEELTKFGINDVRDVLFASLDTGGRLFYQAKNPK